MKFLELCFENGIKLRAAREARSAKRVVTTSYINFPLKFLFFNELKINPKIFNSEYNDSIIIY